jgi:hypothetical protein
VNDLGLATQLVEDILMDNIQEFQRKILEVEVSLERLERERMLNSFVIYEEPDLEEL